MNTFEQYLNDFNSTINIWEFLLNVAIVALIAYLIKMFYIHFGRAISNRRKFSNNFVPLALATMLIISVIKSSVALSLGLVGALSIVRFRAAIKDPEELTYLFLVIGLGLIGGANKPLLAVVAFAVFLPLLYLNNRISNNQKSVSNKATLHIKAAGNDVTKLSDLISPHTNHLELKRADFNDGRVNASFQCLFSDPSSLDKVIRSMKEMDATSSVTYVEQPDLLL